MPKFLYSNSFDFQIRSSPFLMDCFLPMKPTVFFFCWIFQLKTIDFVPKGSENFSFVLSLHSNCCFVVYTKKFRLSSLIGLFLVVKALCVQKLTDFGPGVRFLIQGRCQRNAIDFEVFFRFCNSHFSIATE